MTTTLYRVFDGQERLLYVGISDDPWNRLGRHRNAGWTHHAVRITLETHASREAAAAAELAAIRGEDPVWNNQGRNATRFYKWMMAYPSKHADDISDEELEAAQREVTAALEVRLDEIRMRHYLEARG